MVGGVIHRRPYSSVCVCVCAFKNWCTAIVVVWSGAGVQSTLELREQIHFQSRYPNFISALCNLNLFFFFKVFFISPLFVGKSLISSDPPIWHHFFYHFFKCIHTPKKKKKKHLHIFDYFH